MVSSSIVRLTIYCSSWSGKNHLIVNWSKCWVCCTPCYIVGLLKVRKLTFRQILATSSIFNEIEQKSKIPVSSEAFDQTPGFLIICRQMLEQIRMMIIPDLSHKWNPLNINTLEIVCHQPHKHKNMYNKVCFHRNVRYKQFWLVMKSFPCIQQQFTFRLKPTNPLRTRVPSILPLSSYEATKLSCTIQFPQY